MANRSERALIQLERQRKHGTALPATVNGRGHQRAKTITSVLTSLASALLWAVAGLLLLGQLEISVAPLVAGAGVIGVVVAFGAQNIVADFLAGTFMLIEDQFGVGDIVDVGEASGVVEKVSLRVTTLRDLNGTVWHVPNSQIDRVANMSQVWSRAVLDIEVAYDTDLRRAEGIIQHVADELWQDKEFTGGDIIDPPEVWGVERLGADGVAIRLVVKTDPAEQWVIARELRLRIKEAFDEAGIEIPFPQRTVWLRSEAEVAEPEVAPVDVAPVRQPKVTDELAQNPGS
jgi:small conductance mechanosensitive channel